MLTHLVGGDHKEIFPIVIGHNFANDREAKTSNVTTLNRVFPAVETGSHLIALVPDNRSRADRTINILFVELSDFNFFPHMAAEPHMPAADTVNYFVNHACQGSLTSDSRIYFYIGNFQLSNK